MPFDAFISYSHAADGRLAPAVQRGLHRLARPWHRRRALWIFRDQTGLAVTPGLWSSIQTALDGSEHFVLLASPEAARSPWVNKEIEHWVTTKSPQRILPVLTDGEWHWDAGAGDFTADSTAVPAALRGAFTEEPLYLDLRWARDDLHLNLRHARFRDAIAQLAAPMHGVSKDELESEDVRQLRRARRMWSAAMAVVVVLALVASLSGVTAMRNAGWATASAVEAQRQQANAREQEEQARAAGAETRRQQRLAGEQRTLADRAATDAARQQRNARREQQNARRHQEDARRQKEDAQRQKENARRYEEDARRRQEDARRAEEDARAQKDNAARYEKDARKQKDNAARYEQDARDQQRIADQAEARARQQEKQAREHQKLAEQATEERRKQEKIAKEQQELAREATEEARRQREEAALQRRIEIGHRLMERSRAMVEFDPRKSLMLAVAAQQLHPDPEAGDQLSHLVMATNYAGSLADATDVATLADEVLAVAEAGGAVSLWDITRPAKPTRVGVVPATGTAVKTLTVSPDGKTLAVLDGGPRAVLWDLSEPARPVRRAELADEAGILTVAFSPDGHTVATGNRAGNTVVWDVPDGQAPVARTTLAAAHSMTFSPDGLTAVTSGAAVTVWNVAAPGSPVRVTTLTDARSDSLVLFSPKLAVLIAQDEYGDTVPWDLRVPAQPVDGYPESVTEIDEVVTDMAFSADGTVLALGTSSGTTKLRNLTLGANPGQTGLSRQIVSVSGRDGAVRALTLSRDGRMVISTGDRRTGTVWNIKGAFARDAPTVVSRPVPADIVGFSYRPDGRSVLAADAAGTLGSWDLRDPAAPVEGAQQPLNSGRIQLMALSKDGSTVAVGGMDEVVLLLDVTGPEPVPLATIDEGGGTVEALRFSPDGRTLAVGHLDGTKLFDLTVRKSPRRIARLVERGTVGSVEFSADGLLLGVTSGTSVSLYSLADRADPVRLSEISLGAITFAIAFSPDSSTLAVAPGLTGATTLWDIADLTRPHRLATVQAPDSTVFWMEFSPDGRTLATAGFGTLWLWDVADRSIPVRYASLSHPQLTTRNQMFSPDGRTLASGGSRRLFFWDYTVPEALSADPAGRACAITGRGLDPAEWATYVPELEYRPTC